MKYFRTFIFMFLGFTLAGGSHAVHARSVYGMIDLTPASILISPDIEGFRVSRTSSSRYLTTTYTEEIEGFASLVPMARAGIRFDFKTGAADILAGGGFLWNEAFYAPLVTVESRLRFRVGRVVTLGPHLSYYMISEPTWDGIADVSFSDTSGMDIGVGLYVGRGRVAFNGALSYLFLSPLDVTTGGGWVPSDHEVDLSGVLLRLGVTFAL